MSSVPPDSATQRSQYAITDVYDENRRTFLVQYPISVVVAIGLIGVLAFALTGFLGFSDDPPFQAKVFTQAWPLFLWFCALIMALEISILRNPKLRIQMVAALVVTLISMVIVGIIYFYKVDFLSLITQFLQNVLNIRLLLPQLTGSKYLYAIINFAIIIVFWLDTVRRWIRKSQGKPINSRIDIGLGGTKTTAGPEDDDTSLQELISGDLIAGAALVALLSLIFRSDILTEFSKLLSINVPVTDCVVVWPLGACTGAGGGLANPPTLTFIDLIQTLIYLPLGLLILALSAMLSGFGAVGGVNEQALGQHDAQMAATTGEAGISESVSMTVIDTLRSALNRRLRLALDNMAYSLRNAVWPALILFGVIAVAAAARNTRYYLHLLSDQHTCPTACKATLDAFGWPYQYVLYAGVWGILGIIAIVLAMTLLVFRIRVAENTFRFLGLIGFIILLTFWIFSLALSGFNGLLNLTGASGREPFPPFGVATLISLAALLLWAAIVLVRRMRARSAVSGG